MSKIKKDTVILPQETPARIVRIIKVSDDVFGGKHPKGINEGYIKESWMWQAPEIGVSCVVGDFVTSVVTEIIDEHTFRTKNSTYRIEEVK